MGTSLAIYLVAVTALLSSCPLWNEACNNTPNKTVGLDSGSDVSLIDDHSTSHWVCPPVVNVTNPAVLDLGLMSSEERVKSLVDLCCFGEQNQSVVTNRVISSFYKSAMNGTAEPGNLIIGNFDGGGKPGFVFKHCHH